MLVSRTGSFFEEEEADACVADGGANGCKICWFSKVGVMTLRAASWALLDRVGMWVSNSAEGETCR